MPTTALSRHLTHDQLGRLERLRLVPVRRHTNAARGEHLRRRGGQSIDFADYRDYAPGDDLRFVDWNIFARSHRPYVKVFLQEEELHTLILVDVSASMQREGKLDLALSVAAAFGTVALHGGERVSVQAIGGTPQHLAGLRGRTGLGRLLGFCDQLAAGGTESPEDGVMRALGQHRGRGIALLCSDCLTFGDLRLMMNRLAGAGLEPWVLQILGPSEMNPGLQGDLRLVDCESGLALDVSSLPDLVRIYQEHRDAFLAEVASLATGRGGRHLAVSADLPADQLFDDRWRRTGWVR